MLEKPRIDTAAVHAGRFVVPVNIPSSPPLFQASSYEFEDLDEVEAVYGGTTPGAIYGRYGGPNAHHFESAVAELEGAEAAAATASGMAAIDASIAVTLGRNARMVVTEELYGGTFSLLEKDYQQNGVRVDFVDQTDHAAVQKALRAAPVGILYVEALTNPLMHVADLPALAAAAHEAGAVLIVDATFATPALCRPIEYGADLVVHSVGKYLGGHGDVGAGVIAGRHDLVEAARAYAIRRGATIPHFEAWLALRGVRTLGLRMARHSANAKAIAAFLASRNEVAGVFHPSLPGHPQHEVAERLYPMGTGGIVAFELCDGRPAVERFVAALETVAIVHSLGEVASTISYSVASSHRPVPASVREALGVTDGTLRLSAGIEDVRDIIADLERAFVALAPAMRA